jgi:hypothetical protein
LQVEQFINKKSEGKLIYKVAKELPIKLKANGRE